MTLRFNNLLKHIKDNPDSWLKLLNENQPEEFIPKGWENEGYESEVRDRFKGD
jgi:hypothetical protein